jgi:hypothetical protein
MPAQLIKRFPFQVFLPANDGLMFGNGGWNNLPGKTRLSLSDSTAVMTGSS